MRESEGSSGRIVESTLQESPDSSGGGVLCDSVSSDSAEEDDGRQTGGWLVLCLLLGLSEPRDGGACLSIGSAGADLRGHLRLPTNRRPEGLWTVVGLPAVGKPDVVARLEPLACSQAKGWGRELTPCQAARS